MRISGKYTIYYILLHLILCENFCIIFEKKSFYLKKLEYLLIICFSLYAIIVLIYILFLDMRQMAMT